MDRENHPDGENLVRNLDGSWRRLPKRVGISFEDPRLDIEIDTEIALGSKRWSPTIDGVSRETTRYVNRLPQYSKDSN